MCGSVPVYTFRKILIKKKEDENYKRVTVICFLQRIILYLSISTWLSFVPNVIVCRNEEEEEEEGEHEDDEDEERKSANSKPLAVSLCRSIVFAIIYALFLINTRANVFKKKNIEINYAYCSIYLQATYYIHWSGLRKILRPLSARHVQTYIDENKRELCGSSAFKLLRNARKCY